MFTWAELGTAVTAITALVTAWIAIRKIRFESRDSIVASFQKLIQEQRAEIDRILDQRKERELELQAEIDQLIAAIKASKAERETQIREQSQKHMLELAEVKDGCQKESGTLKEQLQQQQQTITRQTQRIRALERQLGIENQNGGK